MNQYKNKNQDDENKSFPITDQNIIQKLNSLSQEELEKLNSILEESFNELRKKYAIKFGNGQ